MNDTAYEYRGGYLCDACVVPALCFDEPWILWARMGNDHVAFEAEDALDEIATLFNIDRTDPAQVRARGFPVKLSHLPDPPSICSECLHWFS